MTEHQHKFFEDIQVNINSFRTGIATWSQQHNDIEDLAGFSRDMLGELLAFVAKIEHYEVAKANNAAHRQRNYYQELEAAVASTITTMDTVFKTFDSPLFEGDEHVNAETERHRLMLSEVMLFLIRKNIAVKAQHQDLLTKATALQKEGEELLNGLTNAELFSSKTEPEKAETLQRIEVLRATHIKESKNVNKYLQPHSMHFQKIPNRAELRQLFVDKTARIYCDYTGRPDTNRSAEEISLHKKSPFPALLRACFEAASEPVGDDPLRKLIAKTNSAKT